MDITARFWCKVDRRSPNECWPWIAGKTSAGYGGFHPAHGQFVTAHQFAYEITYGEVPAGMWIDHTCHNGTDCPGGKECWHRACCNPAHLEAVTPRDNALRSHRHNAGKKLCPKQHEYTLDTRGFRVCVPCRSERDRIRRAKV